MTWTIAVLVVVVIVAKIWLVGEKWFKRWPPKSQVVRKLERVWLDGGKFHDASHSTGAFDNMAGQQGHQSYTAIYFLGTTR